MQASDDRAAQQACLRTKQQAARNLAPVLTSSPARIQQRDAEWPQAAILRVALHAGQSAKQRRFGNSGATSSSAAHNRGAEAGKGPRLEDGAAAFQQHAGDSIESSGLLLCLLQTGWMAGRRGMPLAAPAWCRTAAARAGPPAWAPERGQRRGTALSVHSAFSGTPAAARQRPRSSAGSSCMWANQRASGRRSCRPAATAAAAAAARQPVPALHLVGEEVALRCEAARVDQDVGVCCNARNLHRCIRE